MEQQPEHRPQAAAGDETITGIELCLYSLARRLMQGRLHEYFARQAGVDIDQAGLAVLYVVARQSTSPRVTDVAARLSIDAPAVTRKAQQLERQGLVSRSRDAADARVSLLRLTPAGRRVLRRFLLVRHRWFMSVLADWPAAERREFARLIDRFSHDIQGHLDELDL
jgi:DNA-binding MarR family transcriptional regulator